MKICTDANFPHYCKNIHFVPFTPATVLFGPWEQMVRNLLSTETPTVLSATILGVNGFLMCP